MDTPSQREAPDVAAGATTAGVNFNLEPTCNWLECVSVGGVIIQQKFQSCPNIGSLLIIVSLLKTFLCFSQNLST